MDKHTTAFDLDSNELSFLLKMGLSNPSETTDNQSDKTNLWLQCLAQPLPSEASQLQDVPVALADYWQQVGTPSEETVGGLLKNPQTDLVVMKVLKQYAKQQSRQGDSKASRDINNTLCYAAIAHAMIYHQQHITSFGYVDLTDKFQRLSKLSWLDADTRKLFCDALEQCQTKRL